MICETCGAEFVRPAKSRRVNCSRSCAVAASWRNEDCRKKRAASISVVKSTPQAVARMREVNTERWSRPGEREKLSERNRVMWSDLRTREELTRLIIERNTSLEFRARCAGIRRAAWRDPVQRSWMVLRMRESHSRPEVRAKLSDRMTRTWQDPVQRPRLLENCRRLAADPELRARSSARMKLMWQERRAAALRATSCVTFVTMSPVIPREKQALRDMLAEAMRNTARMQA